MKINPSCILCGSNKAKEIYRQEEQNHIYKLLKCSRCGLVSLYPRLWSSEQLGLDVFTGTLNEVQFESQSFDIVTLWDVLEHELHPKVVLNQIYRVLKPGGFLLISCPNIEALFPQITRMLFYKTFRFWEFPLIPHHLYEFTPDSIELLLNNAGFRLVNTISMDIPRDFYLNSWKPLQNQSLKLRLLKLSTSLVYRLLFSVLYPLANLLKRGNAFVYVAKKE